GTWWLSGYLNQLHLDPPDAHFKTVVKAHPHKALKIKADKAAGVTPKLARIINSLFQNQAQEVGLADAIATSVNRADGAALAGKTKFEKLQLRAVRKFRKQLARLIRMEIKLRLKASAASGVSIAGKI